MKINVRLDTGFEPILESLKYKTKKNVSEIIRDALIDYYNKINSDDKTDSYELAKKHAFIGSFDSSEDLSTNYKKYLTKSLKDKHGHR